MSTKEDEHPGDDFQKRIQLEPQGKIRGKTATQFRCVQEVLS
jgi:hypothetical protein